MAKARAHDKDSQAYLPVQALLQQPYVTFFSPSFEPLGLHHVDPLLLVVAVEKDRIHLKNSLPPGFFARHRALWRLSVKSVHRPWSFPISLNEEIEVPYHLLPHSKGMRRYNGYAAPFRIIIYRPFFPPVPSRMKIVVAARPVVNSSLAAAVFRTDRRLTCMHRYLRSVVSSALRRQKD
ncbi:hypothetical protein HU200_033239 [Digitaria exilis]|uniref:Uncharacterized protein n=1 Tax=Digitaria exilis TaxID=1010633 RepID=A0A835ERG7_9POAL|nr:hypothetical protein HU200_033239 [Digitaria exilis]